MNVTLLLDLLVRGVTLLVAHNLDDFANLTAPALVLEVLQTLRQTTRVVTDCGNEPA